MVRFFKQSHVYDDPWSTVALAFFLRYPNPYASHVLSCDVISRTVTPSGTLLTTRLILKRGALPKWAPRGVVSRTESWIVEESEVDCYGRTVRCKTRNLDHVKVMQVQESVVLTDGPPGKTLQQIEASIVSNFGWGLAKRIEKYGASKFKSNIERSRQGIAFILHLLRESRPQTLTLGSNMDTAMADAHNFRLATVNGESDETPDAPKGAGGWPRLRSWFSIFRNGSN